MESKVTSATFLKKIFQEKGLKPNRRLGQHFLVDENILDKIIRAASLREDDLVLDLGAGAGAISLAIAPEVEGVIAVEWDEGLASLLKELAASKGRKNLHVIRDDMRCIDLEKICIELWGRKIDKGRGIKVVANLPYYLTTPILFKLLRGTLKIELLVLMVQLEAARRIVAQPGTKDYGTLTVLCLYYAQPEILFRVSRNVFYPPPEVDSAMVSLKVLPEPAIDAGNEEVFWKVVRSAFQKRRKTLLNALKNLGVYDKEEWKKILEEANISPHRRGETLSIEEFANLSKIIYNKKGFFHFFSPMGNKERRPLP